MKNIEDLRKQIDKIDESIISLLAKRMNVVKQVGKFKKENNIPIFNKKRLEIVLKNKKGYLKKIWEIIHKEALKVERGQ